MMSQSSLFAEEPFLSWEQNYQPLSSLHQHFFKHRTKLADVLLKELHEGSEMAKPSGLPLEPSKHNSKEKEAVSPHLRGVTSHNNGDLLVTLDARGYAPSDITVKLEGRTLAVVAMKQAGAEESQSSSSSSSCASFCSSASSQTGFVQRIDLPPNLDLPGLSCNLMDNGQLCIHAPAAKQPIEEEHQVPIRFKTSLEFPITKDKSEEVKTN
ncbi:heat shock protein beta-9 [Gouania willdenowi]|uniref:heat shock protein beta-9 n=1 Tax=Gouania willdenowi TaxID=441366 RepID=UPI0010558621|nr:uncharacterized protein LOC114467863 [Gouania willdenowi]